MWIHHHHLHSIPDEIPQSLPRRCPRAVLGPLPRRLLPAWPVAGWPRGCTWPPTADTDWLLPLHYSMRCCCCCCCCPSGPSYSDYSPWARNHHHLRGTNHRQILLLLRRHLTTTYSHSSEAFPCWPPILEGIPRPNHSARTASDQILRPAAGKSSPERPAVPSTSLK